MAAETKWTPGHDHPEGYSCSICTAEAKRLRAGHECCSTVASIYSDLCAALEASMILDALEFVDCDECRAVGQYRVTGPDTVECQVCGHPYAIGPCDCPDHAKES